MFDDRHLSALSAPALRGVSVFGAYAILLLFSAAGMAQPERQVDSLLERRQHHVVLQRWDLSCGAAALATILNYQHGDQVSERDVAVGLMGREEYLANPDIVRAREGFSLLDLKRYVDSRGYNGVGLGRLSIDDLAGYAPIIVPISLNGYRHFVVFQGIRGNRVLVADPAFGNRSMSLRKFERSWLDLPELGHVGFYVERIDASSHSRSLSADDDLRAESRQSRR